MGLREEMAWHQGAKANQTSRWDRPDGPVLLSTLQPTRHASLISPGAVTRTILKSITKQIYSYIFTFSPLLLLLKYLVCCFVSVTLLSLLKCFLPRTGFRGFWNLWFSLGSYLLKGAPKTRWGLP